MPLWSKSSTTNIGRIVAVLNELKLRENHDRCLHLRQRQAFCTSRPGEAGTDRTCNLPLRSGEGWTLRSGIRIATSISWPAGLKPAARQRVPSYTADLYPTLLELCDLPLRPEQHRDGCRWRVFFCGGEV